MDRNQFLKRTTKIIGIFLLIYIVYNMLVGVWVGSTVEIWIFVLGVIAFLSVAFGFGKIIRYLNALYLERGGVSARVNMATLKTISNVLAFGFTCIMAMRAVYSDRADSLIVWCVFSIYIIYQLFIEIRLVNKLLQQKETAE